MAIVTQGPIGPAVAGNTTPTPAGKGKSALGKDDFLQLLVTQLRHQDPSSPQDSSAFAAQLAQFSGLESMQNIESLLTNQGNANALTTLAMKADLGASFIGKDVLAAGNTLEALSDGPQSVTVDIGTGGGNTTLHVLDAGGKEVASRDLGFTKAGRQTINTGDLPTGDYTYTVTTTALSGDDVPVQTYTSGIVDGVSFESGQVILHAGKLNFLLDNVVEVQQPSPAAAAIAAAASARILPSKMEQAHS